MLALIDRQPSDQAAQHIYLYCLHYHAEAIRYRGASFVLKCIPSFTYLRGVSVQEGSYVNFKYSQTFGTYGNTYQNLGNVIIMGYSLYLLIASSYVQNLPIFPYSKISPKASLY